MRRTCPRLSTVADEQQPAASLACLQALHGVQLDGRKLTGLLYEVGSDPGTARPALLAMIDVRALARGRHELQVARASAPDDERPEASAPYRIPFWR
jgi:hypothetical protein